MTSNLYDSLVMNQPHHLLVDFFFIFSHVPGYVIISLTSVALVVMG